MEWALYAKLVWTIFTRSLLGVRYASGVVTTTFAEVGVELEFVAEEFS